MKDAEQRLAWTRGPRVRIQSYEPPTLQNGTLQPVEIMTASAGMVLLDLTSAMENGPPASSRISMIVSYRQPL